MDSGDTVTDNKDSLDTQDEPLLKLNETPVPTKSPWTWKRKVPLVCAYCQKVFHHKTQHEIHLRIHTGERPYECNICHIKFKRHSHLKEHRLNVHLKRDSSDSTSSKTYPCEICHRVFYYSSSLNKHLRTHFNEYVFECPYCPKKYKHDSSFNYHLASIHYGKNVFQCDICNKTLKGTRTEQTRHMSKHSGVDAKFSKTDLEFKGGTCRSNKQKYLKKRKTKRNKAPLCSDIDKSEKVASINLHESTLQTASVEYSNCVSKREFSQFTALNLPLKMENSEQYVYESDSSTATEVYAEDSDNNDMMLNKDSVPNDKDSVPNDKDSVPNDKDSVPNDKDSVPNDKDSVPNDKDSIPNNKDSIPNDKDSVPNDNDSIPNDKDSVPNNKYVGDITAKGVDVIEEDQAENDDVPYDNNVVGEITAKSEIYNEENQTENDDVTRDNNIGEITVKREVHDEENQTEEYIGVTVKTEYDVLELQQLYNNDVNSDCNDLISGDANDFNTDTENEVYAEMDNPFSPGSTSTMVTGADCHKYKYKYKFYFKSAQSTPNNISYA